MAAGQGAYVPALGRRSLTALYDPVLRLTTRERSFKERLLAQASLAGAHDVLDLGCGTGTLAVWAKRRAPDARVRGIDGDLEVLTRARAKAAREGVEIEFEEGLSFDLPYPDASFDRVLSSLFFHHLRDPDKERTLAEVRRVLRPRGELHVADWGTQPDRLMSALSLSIRTLDGREPTRANFAGELPAMFERAGLGEVQVRGGLRTVYGALSFYSAVRA
jgi:ubiquinone/menaquinone biosynthesis C-methylase UbiE